MATHLQKKISMVIATDIISSESLSFSDLLSVQDLQSKLPPKNDIIQIKKQEQEFEFSHITPKLASHTSNKSCPADISTSSGQTQLRVLLNQSKQVNHAPSSTKAVMRNNNKRSSSSNNHSMEVSDTPNPNERNQAKRQPDTNKLSFGQKIFQSLVSPCRECHASNPSIRVHTVTKETVMLS